MQPWRENRRSSQFWLALQDRELESRFHFQTFALEATTMLMWKEKRGEKTGSPSRQFVVVHLTLFSLYINKLLHCPFSSNNNENNLVSAIRVGTFSLTDTRRAIFNIVNCLSWNNFSMVKGKKKKTKKKFIHVLCNVARFPAAPSASSYLRVSSLVSWETRT